MAVSPTFRDYVLDQLGRVAPDLRARGMFGGVGIYSGELFFALIDDDTLYLKVDAGNRADFEAIGMGPFRPFGEEGEVNLEEMSGNVMAREKALQLPPEEEIDPYQQDRRHRGKRTTVSPPLQRPRI